MKNKFIVSIGLLLTFASLCSAATLYSSNVQSYSVNQTPSIIFPLTITAQNDNEITAAKGIRIIIPEGVYAIWAKEVTSVSVTGTAVTGNKISDPAKVTYPTSDYRTALIEVKTDFAKNEAATISGLTMRFYNEGGSSMRYLGLDINGDNIIDSNDINGIEVLNNNTYSDTTNPYAVTGLKAEQTSTNRIKLSWINPPDLDISKIIIERRLTRNNGTIISNFELPTNRDNAGKEQTFEENVQVGDVIIYNIYVRDLVNISPMTSVTITIVENPVLTQETTQEATQETTQQTTQEATQQSTQETGTQQPGAVCAGFSDVLAGDAECEVITFVKDQGIFEGYPDGSFKPGQAINRAETVKVIVNGFKVALLADDGTKLGFSDVIAGEWYMGFLKTAKEAGIIGGYPDGTFKPEQTVNYVEMYKIFFETADSMLAEDVVSSTVAEPWYQKYLYAAGDNGITVATEYAKAMTRYDVANLFYEWSKRTPATSHGIVLSGE